MSSKEGSSFDHKQSASGRQPEYCNYFLIPQEKKKKNKEKREKQEKEKKREVGLGCLPLSFSGFDENTMKIGSTNDQLVDTTNPAPSC